MKNWKKKLGELSFTKGYYFKMGDNALVEKKDDQLIFTRKELEHFIEQELDKAREEGARDVLERILENIPVCRNLNGYEGEGWIMEDDLRNILSKLNKKK